MAKSEVTAELAASIDRAKLGQIVLVLQGGGALDAYQAGVYQALQEVGVEPDWVIGTSIGAINASLIAGNPPEMRLERLREFWDRVRRNPFAQITRRGRCGCFHARRPRSSQRASKEPASHLVLVCKSGSSRCLPIALFARVLFPTLKKIIGNATLIAVGVPLVAFCFHAKARELAHVKGGTDIHFLTRPVRLIGGFLVEVGLVGSPMRIDPNSLKLARC